ncbi:aromatic amino acid lyase [Streptomyces sp. 8N706]|uniref:aromatic amino acid lyase n=1 Tax=Streptomyces sp. 8N706 TaxID=3457416 RepID=UPI003FD5CA43
MLKQSAWGRRLVFVRGNGARIISADLGNPGRRHPPVTPPDPVAATDRVLPPEVVRTMVWLRLRALAWDLPQPAAETWHAFARQWNGGYTPVVPLLVGRNATPLVHAAWSCAGHGLAWRRMPGGWQRMPAAQALRRLRLDPVPWDNGFVREFVRGDEAALAFALHLHLSLRSLTDVVAACAVRLRPLLTRAPGPGSREMSAEDRLREPYVLWAAHRELCALRDEVARQGDLVAGEAERRTGRPLGTEGAAGPARVALWASEQQVRGARMLAFFAQEQLRLALRAEDRDDGAARGRPGRDRRADEAVVAELAVRLTALQPTWRGSVGECAAAPQRAMEALDDAWRIARGVCAVLTGEADGGRERERGLFVEPGEPEG